jgi:hypothetical protein
MEERMKRVGKFLGMPIYEDPKLRPDEARMVSFAWDPIEQRMKERDSVRIVNLR